MSATVAGAVIGLLNATPAYAGLATGGTSFGDSPPERALPFGVLSEAHAPRHKRLTSEADFLEEHSLALHCYAGPTLTAGQPNPADLMALAAEAALDRQNVALQGQLDGASVVSVLAARELQKERPRTPQDLRVYRGSLDVKVTLHRRAPG
jgi:hypothetical protein